MKVRKLLSAVLCILILFSLVQPAAAASYRSFSFKKLGGGTVTENDCAGKPIVFVFLKEGCSNSQNTLRTLSSASWVQDCKVQFILCYISSDNATAARSFFDTYGEPNDAFLYTYGSETVSFMWSLLNGANSVTLACVVVVGTNGGILSREMAVSSAYDIQQQLSGIVDWDNPMTPPDTTVEVTYSGTADYSKAYEVLDKLNALRRSLGLNELVMDSTLLDIAMRRAAECALYYSHTRPDGSDCFDIFPASCFLGAENIAIGQRSAAEVMEDWTNSPGHYSNMTNMSYDAVGIGCYRQSDGTYVWSQDFTAGSPYSAAEVSGTRTRTDTVSVLPENLSLFVSPGSFELSAGQTVTVKLFSENVEFPYTAPELTPTFSESENPLVAVVSGATVTANGGGSTKVKLGLSSELYAEAGVTVKGAPAVCVHNYVGTVTEPTCTAGGYTTYECTICHDTYIAEETPPKEHTPGGWIIDTEPGCCSKGLRHKECTVCHRILQSEVMEAAGHTFENGVCVRCGLHQYTVTVCYVFSDGGTASPTVSEAYPEGESYLIPSPLIEGYDPDIPLVFGIAEEDVEILVTYSETETGSDVYSVTVRSNDSSMGAAAATPSTGREGTEITLQAIAYPGYHFVKWESEDIAVSEEGTFVMPARDVAVTAVFAKEEPAPSADCGGAPDKCPSAKFTDVAPYGDWSHAGIDFCVERGLFGGTSETTFEPDVAMNRAMLVTVLWRYEGAPKGYGSGFSDIVPGQWYTDAVAWASSNGIVNGIGNNKFDPDGTVTREQLATILCRYAEWKLLPTGNRTDFSFFPDAGEVSSWAITAMQWAVAEGLIGGSEEGGKTYILPADGATRAQVATILMRFIRNIAEY